MLSSLSLSEEFSSCIITGLFCPGRVDRIRGGKMAIMKKINIINISYKLILNHHKDRMIGYKSHFICYLVKSSLVEK
jgi:hypothetical protein